MHKYTIFSLISLLLCSGSSFAQAVTGKVTSEHGPLEHALVFWADTNVGTTTDVNGNFTIERLRGHDSLVASHLGYRADTVKAIGRMVTFTLTPDPGQIDAVTVDGDIRGNYSGLSGIVKNEFITFRGLTKMACCNLAESFENSASVSVGYSDAVSGARQIRMLGLTGIYTQLLDESRPVMRGLGTTYGLSYTPGMWLQGIQVSKGTSSVAHGHEAIAGQINLEYRKPTDEAPLFINGYIDEQLRTELNAASSLRVNDRLSTVVLTHGSIDELGQDHNHDSFLDVPTTRQVNVANRWLYALPNDIQLRAGVKYVREERRGGQKDFRAKEHRGGTAVYGSRIGNENFNAYLKAAVPVGKSLYDRKTGEVTRSNIALVTDYDFYRQDAYFGLKDYNGIQNSFYANLIYNLYLDSRHTLVFGATATVDNYSETLQDRYTEGTAGSYTVYSERYDLGRKETESGAYAEYNLNAGDKFNFIAGVRADHHSLHDWIVTPRAHLRWQIIPGLVLRGSAGKGSRSAAIITDNIGMLATGRKILFADYIERLEQSVTLGGSLSWSFRLGADDSASLSFDYFHTRFSNQVVADQEYESGIVYVYNVGGHPTTNTWQADFNWSPFTGFDLLATFRYTGTELGLERPDGTTRRVSRPLTDKFKTLVNMQYATRFRRWVFDFTAQLNGQSRLPDLDGTGSGRGYSPVYPMFFAQVSRKFRKFELYLGCENIGNYTQDEPVIGASDPFGRGFNSSVVWGPLMGRKVYAGFRFNL